MPRMQGVWGSSVAGPPCSRCYDARMAKREYTVGVIGLGFGRSHIPAFQAHGCRVVAVCQRNRAHAEEIAGKYGVEGVFERWEDLLEKARPEIVVIATPPHLHKPIALAAFAQGAHVL